ncbi:MAG: ABC transporter permease [Deltaproteobacteria bacterium]|nr:ABC transporter permease [Deltaproteobacteria bacterium]
MQIDEVTQISVAAPEEATSLPFLLDVLLRLVREKPLGTVGGAIVILLLLVGVFANFLAPFSYTELHLMDSLVPPSSKYFFGTDDLGRDLFSRIIYGARISMYVGLGCSAIGLTISVIIGLLCGFIGGKFDLIMQRLVDAWLCFPPLFIILAVMAVIGPGLIQVILVLGVLFGVARSRIIRSAVIGVKENVYVEAARAIGVPTGRILRKHIIPNIMAPMIILFTIDMGAAIIAEASMSFLGYGIPPPIPSWGGMLSWGGRQFMRSASWMALWPGLALAIVAWGINMLGDGLRDILDPRLRGGLGRYNLNMGKLLRKLEQKYKKEEGQGGNKPNRT